VSLKLPLVLDLTTGGPQQLQPVDDVDIPLEKRFQDLLTQFNILVTFMVAQGFDVPEEIINDETYGR
jgi:hypothetical protein